MFELYRKLSARKSVVHRQLFYPQIHKKYWRITASASSTRNTYVVIWIRPSTSETG